LNFIKIYFQKTTVSIQEKKESREGLLIKIIHTD